MEAFENNAEKWSLNWELAYSTCRFCMPATASFKIWKVSRKHAFVLVVQTLAPHAMMGMEYVRR